MTKTILTNILFVSTLTVASAGLDPFESYSRAGKGEIYGFGQYWTGWETAQASGLGVSLKLDSAFGGGLGLGVNLNDYLNLNTDFAVAPVDITGRMGFGTVKGEATALQWALNLDYNILKTRLTPLITGGGGIMHFNGDYGSSASEFTETDPMWGGGAGVRWEVTDNLMLRVVYRVNWTSLKDTDDPIMFHTISAGIGLVF